MVVVVVVSDGVILERLGSKIISRSVSLSLSLTRFSQSEYTQKFGAYLKSDLCSF